MIRKDYPLQHKIDRGVLTISIGIDTLAWAFEHQDENNPYEEISHDEDGPVSNFVQRYKVIDNEEFARDVIRELFNEEEDGSNPINVLLDKMCIEAVDQGSIAVEDLKHPEWYSN